MSNQPPQLQAAGKPSLARLLLFAAVALSLLSLSWFWFQRGQSEVDLPEKLALTPEEQKYLQDVEHSGGFIVGFQVANKIRDALRQSDAAFLTACLAKDFRGSFFEGEGNVSDFRFGKIQVFQSGQTSHREYGGDGFVAQLLKQRGDFQTLDYASFKIGRLGPVQRGNLDGRWEGDCFINFGGRSENGEIVQRRSRLRIELSFVSEEMLESGGFISALETVAGSVAKTRENLFHDITADTGIATSTLWDNWRDTSQMGFAFITGGVYLADYDQDGLVDVLLTDINGPALYRGLGNGRFSDQSGLLPDSVTTTDAAAPPNLSELSGAIFADFNGDGFEDLILGSRLLRNASGRYFEYVDCPELAMASGSYAVADYDRDGLVDLYILGVPSGEAKVGKFIDSQDGVSNILLRNLGNFRFEDVTEQTGTAGSGGVTFSAVWFDANSDGWPDLMTACEFGKNDYLINREGKFEEHPLPHKFGGFSMGITSGDIDNDGFPDPFVANMYSKSGNRIVNNVDPKSYDPDTYAKIIDFTAGNELYHNQGDGKFERTGQVAGIADVGWSYGPGYADFDADGKLDLYVPAGYKSVTRDRPDG